MLIQFWCWTPLWKCRWKILWGGGIEMDLREMEIYLSPLSRINCLPSSCLQSCFIFLLYQYLCLRWPAYRTLCPDDGGSRLNRKFDTCLWMDTASRRLRKTGGVDGGRTDGRTDITRSCVQSRHCCWRCWRAVFCCSSNSSSISSSETLVFCLTVLQTSEQDSSECVNGVNGIIRAWERSVNRQATGSKSRNSTCILRLTDA
jgi:hypothetical protein